MELDNKNQPPPKQSFVLNSKEVFAPPLIQTQPSKKTSSKKPKIFFILFVIISFLIAFIIGGFVLGSR
ncbi:MAG: hypothetical protein Q7K55_07040 [Candidatus Levybacteria bacterium]|nr:hypothetical protein [Candidatus Levybacteria bacterium]